jgi:hypothetical protein
MKPSIFSLWFLLALGELLAAEPVYQNDFSQAEVGQVPAEFLVLDGQFAVQLADNNKVLELPGAPLETFGVLFGPSGKDAVAVSARIHGTGKGRRFPVFAVSLGGVGGYKLQVAPAKQAIEILQGEETRVSAPFVWKSGTWTRLRLEIRKFAQGTWQITGKAWPEPEPEPATWTASLTAAAEPLNGKAGVWGKPFSGTPIQFDDLKVETLEP